MLKRVFYKLACDFIFLNTRGYFVCTMVQYYLGIETRHQSKKAYVRLNGLLNSPNDIANLF